MPVTQQRIFTFADLVEGYQHSDPKLYQILSSLLQAVGDLQEIIDPVITTVNRISGIELVIPKNPKSAGWDIFVQRVLRIHWTAGTNAATYEVRKGTTWDTSEYITATNQLEVRLDPVVAGSYTYLIRARSTAGTYAEGSVVVPVYIPPIGAISVTSQVIDNFVLLRYSEPTSPWEVFYYNIYKGSDVIGFIDSTFFVYFENTGGSYTYAIEPVDIVGQHGPKAYITVDVHSPADFVLIDDRLSLLSGYRHNALIYGEPEYGWDFTDAQGWATEDYVWFGSNTGKLLVCIDTAQIYEAHFLTRSWDQPSDQIDAGYPVYIQPAAMDAQYKEVIDYGAVFENVILNLNWTLEQMSSLGFVSVQSLIEFSLDGITYDPAVPGPSAFTRAFRYVRLTFDFISNNDKALAIFSNLHLILDVKLELDSGEVNALSTDASGTQVLFNKDFKDVHSITVATTKQIEPLQPVYDFLDVANPTSFKVFVFDSTGNRVTALVSWKARGVV